MIEPAVAVGDSTLRQISELRDIAARHAELAEQLRDHLAALMTLCADSVAGQVFSFGPAAGLVTAIAGESTRLHAEIRCINDGLIAATCALALTDRTAS